MLHRVGEGNMPADIYAPLISHVIDSHVIDCLDFDLVSQIRLNLNGWADLRPPACRHGWRNPWNNQR